MLTTRDGIWREKFLFTKDLISGAPVNLLNSVELLALFDEAIKDPNYEYPANTAVGMASVNLNTGEVKNYNSIHQVSLEHKSIRAIKHIFIDPNTIDDTPDVKSRDGFAFMYLVTDPILQDKAYKFIMNAPKKKVRYSTSITITRISDKKVFSYISIAEASRCLFADLSFDCPKHVLTKYARISLLSGSPVKYLGMRIEAK